MKKMIIAVLALAMIAVNALGAMGKMGISMRDLSTIFPFDFMPPALLFMISWGLIYLGQLVYVGVIVRDKNPLSQEEFGYNLVLILSNIGWMIATTQQCYWTSIVLIVLMYICLVMLGIRFSRTGETLKSVIFGLYLGWITAAVFVVTLGQGLYLLDSSLALSASWWALALGVVATLLTFYFVRNKVALAWSLLVVVVTALKVMGYIAF